jgi:hypothetical protein
MWMMMHHAKEFHHLLVVCDTFFLRLLVDAFWMNVVSVDELLLMMISILSFSRKSILPFHPDLAITMSIDRVVVDVDERRRTTTTLGHRPYYSLHSICYLPWILIVLLLLWMRQSVSRFSLESI